MISEVLMILLYFVFRFSWSNYSVCRCIGTRNQSSTETWSEVCWRWVELNCSFIFFLKLCLTGLSLKKNEVTIAFSFKTIDASFLVWKTSFKKFPSRFAFQNTMKSHIASPDNLKVEDYKHSERFTSLFPFFSNSRIILFFAVFRPISSTGKLIINMRPEVTNFCSPMFWVDLVINEMKFALSRSQYVDITSTLSSVNRMVLQGKYLKYRPTEPLSKKTLRLWWKYAYKAILEETVRRRRRMWSWNHIKNHRALCKQYIEVYTRVLQVRRVVNTSKVVFFWCELAMLISLTKASLKPVTRWTQIKVPIGSNAQCSFFSFLYHITRWKEA